MDPLTGVAVLILVLWLLGLLIDVGGALIHLLLVIAIIVVLIKIIQGRNPVSG